MTRLPPPRLALVELRATDIFSQYRTGLYPFFAGFAEARALPWRWVSVGFDRETQPLGPFVVTLPPADLRVLAETLRAHAATHVICNEHLAPETRAQLDEAVTSGGERPSLVWHTMGTADALGPESFDVSPEALGAWLGVEAEPTNSGARHAGLVDAVSPRFADEQLGTLRPPALVPIVGGTNCLYQRPITRSPALARLSSLPHHARFGCTFCGSRTTASYPYQTDPVTLARRQIEAAEAAWQDPSAPHSYLLDGIRAVLRVDEVVVPLLGLLRGPRHFHISLRANELRARAAAVERAVAACAEGGHRLHLSNMGVENFSPAENGRFNKGLDAEDVFEALALIHGWGRRYPGAIAFDEDGGFGFILFTPWTTLGDLEANAEALVRLPPATHSFVLTTRLLLQPERAITALAQVDGALTESWPDPVHGRFSRAGCLVSADDVELPWRFLHPEADLVCRLMMRAEPQAAAHVDPADEGLEAVRRVLAPWGPMPPLLSFFRGALAALRAPDPPTTVAALAVAAAARMGQPKITVHQGAPSWCQQLSVLARALETHPRAPLGPLRVKGLACDDRGTAHLRLESPSDGTLEVLIAPRRPGGPDGLVVAGGFTLSHAPDTPVTTRAARRAFRALARALATASRAARETRRAGS